MGFIMLISLFIIIISIGVFISAMITLLGEYFSHKRKGKENSKYVYGNFTNFKLLSEKYNLLEYHRDSSFSYIHYMSFHYNDSQNKSHIRYSFNEIVFNDVGFIANNFVDYFKIRTYMQEQSYIIRENINNGKQITMEELVKESNK